MEARQSHPPKTRLAEFDRPCDRTRHRRPLIRAPRNHNLDIAPTGHVGFKRLYAATRLYPKRVIGRNCHETGGWATWRCHLAGFLFLWHVSVRLYTYRQSAVKKGNPYA